MNLQDKKNTRYNNDRNAEIYHTMTALNISYAQLGRKFNLSRQRVHAIIKEYKKRYVDNS